MYRYTDGSQGDGGAQKKSRALIWKMSNANVAPGYESTSSTDIMEYRFAEILLNIAECYAAQGNAGECTNYLRQIRNRVGAGTDDLATLNGKYDLIRAVLNERAVELAYEGKRSWDMRRWLLFEGGAGFDPRLAGINDDTREYDPELAYGAGWKIYNGKDGRPTYTKNDNVLTRLGLPRFCGTKQQTKIWAYNLGTIQNMDVRDEEDNFQHPLQNNSLLMSVTPITRDMNEAERNAAFDELENFYEGVDMGDHIEANGTRVSMTGKSNVKTRLGVRLQGSTVPDVNNVSRGQGFLELNWIRNSQRPGVVMNGVEFKEEGAKHLGEFRIGMEGQMTENLHGFISGGIRAGGSGWHEETLNVGLKYTF